MISRLITFLKETKIEMKRVNWLTRKELWNFTLTVIAFSLITAVFLGMFDFIFRYLLDLIIF